MTEIQFGAPTPAPASAVEAAKVVEAALDATQEAVAEVAADAHTHESILIGLFADLEGIVHMGKSEIHSVIERWKAEYQKA